MTTQSFKVGLRKAAASEGLMKTSRMPPDLSLKLLRDEVREQDDGDGHPVTLVIEDAYALLDIADAALELLISVQERVEREEDGPPVTNVDPYETENPAIIRETRLRPAIARLQRPCLERVSL